MNILNVTQERQILCCSQLAQLHKARAMHTSEESGPKWSLMKKKTKNNPKLTIAQYWNSAFAEHLNISSVASPNDALYDAQIYKQRSDFSYHPCLAGPTLLLPGGYTRVLPSRERLLLHICLSCLKLPGCAGIPIPSNMRLTISESLNSPGFSEKDNLNPTRNVILSAQCWKAAWSPALRVSLWGSVQCFWYSGFLGVVSFKEIKQNTHWKQLPAIESSVQSVLKLKRLRRLWNKYFCFLLCRKLQNFKISTGKDTLDRKTFSRV